MNKLDEPIDPRQLEASQMKTSNVARGFDRHVREQLPWYDLATNAILHVARHYIPQDGLVYDFGASTGNIGRALAPILKERTSSPS